jgi:hypothetical protein
MTVVGFVVILGTILHPGYGKASPYHPSHSLVLDVSRWTECGAETTKYASYSVCGAVCVGV